MEFVPKIAFVLHNMPALSFTFKIAKPTNVVNVINVNTNANNVLSFIIFYLSKFQLKIKRSVYT